jgi:murein DD-endopeptidase MepM/ murein hydrolase activator NlpD
VNRTRAAFAAALLLAAGFTAGPAIEPRTAQVAADQFKLSGPLEQGGLVFGKVPSGTTRLSLDQKPIPFDAAGRFIIGFDRDQPSTALLSAQLGNGTWIQQWLRIAPRAWQIEHIDQDRPSTGPTPEYQKIRDAELARIAAARGFDSGSTGWKQHFIRPAGGRISGLFGAQRIYHGGVPAAFHGGLDMAPGAGKPVVAPADGVVVLAGPPAFSLEGNLVIIDHGLGLNSAFLHMATSLVQPGDHVRQGQQIGTVGMTGRATGPHLHWSVVWRGARLDPLLLVQSNRPPASK